MPTIAQTRSALALAAALAAAGAAGPARGDPPITLDEALAMAARRNTDVALARADVAAAEADEITAISGVLPRLDLGASFERDWFGPQDARTLQSGGVPFPIPEQAAYSQPNYTLQLSLQQPVFDGLRAVRRIQAAYASRRAYGHQLDETRLGVAFVVTQRFYELVKAERSLAVLQETVRRSEDLVARAEARFAAGRAPKADTYQARVNLGNDRIAVEAQRAAVARARSNLAVALGRGADAPLQVVAPAVLDQQGIPTADAAPLEELVAMARNRRAAVAATRAAVEAARAQVGAAQADYWPTLSLAGAYGRQSNVFSGTGGVYGDPSRNYAVIGQVLVSWNLFAGRQTLASVQRAEVGVQRAEANQQKTSDQVARELSDAREAAIALARQVAIAADNLVAAEQGLALQRQRLEAGLANQLELRDASLKLTQSQLSLVQARIDHQVAVADLTRAVGGPP